MNASTLQVIHLKHKLTGEAEKCIKLQNILNLRFIMFCTK